MTYSKAGAAGVSGIPVQNLGEAATSEQTLASEMLQDFPGVNLTNPPLLAFARKINVTTDPEIQKSMAQDLRDTRRYPRVPSVVTVQARGTSFTKRADYALGDPGTPETRMTDEQLREKFYLYADETLGALRTETLWLELQSLDSSEHFGRVVHDLTAA